MAQIITKDDEAHPSHPNYPVNAAKREAAGSEKETKKEVKVPERKTENKSE